MIQGLERNYEGKKRVGMAKWFVDPLTFYVLHIGKDTVRLIVLLLLL